MSPIPTHGFDAPPSATGSPWPNPIQQEGDPGAVGPGTWWVIPSTGATMLRNEANTGWETTSSGASIPPATTVTGPDAFGAPAAVGTGTHYARNDHDHGLPGNPAPDPATTVTGPDAYGAPADVGTSPNYALEDHDHGLPAAPPVDRVSNGNAVGGAADYVAREKLVADTTYRVIVGLDSSDQGVIGFGPGGATAPDVFLNRGSFPAYLDKINLSGDLNVLGAGNFFGSLNLGGTAITAIPSCRIGAGVPTGAPVAGENGMAADTTAISGGLYAWTGSAWLKVSTI